MHLFFHQDLSKHHETKIDEGVWKIISYIKVRVYASKKIAPKQMTFHLFLYASFSLKQPLFFNLTLCLLGYWIVFPTTYLHFYLLISDILRILKFIQCRKTFFIKTSRILMRLDVLFLKFSVSKYSYYALIFYEKFLPVNGQDNS